MPDIDPVPSRKGHSQKAIIILVASYAADWLCLIAAGIGGVFLGNVTPNKRHFYLNDPNIAFPFTERETVNSTLLLICNAVIPVAIIFVVALVFVPGSTVPKGTPKSLIWKRKLWELHVGWLGLGLSLMAAWLITQGMKNMFGKPRPDLLARCIPDLANIDQYVVSPRGLGQLSAGVGQIFQLVSAKICTNTDKHLLDDGFRSYPSGHASSAAAGLIYLSFFLASKFSVTIPFVSSGYTTDSNAVSAFPSRSRLTGRVPSPGQDELAAPSDPMVAKQISTHSTTVLAVRRQAAAPPIYLLVLVALPFFTAIFVASSRWFDFRHHGFDILFGFIIGTITAWFAFRYYHLPISQGAGWAWAPRSHDKAFWAGVGSYSYATDKKEWLRPGDEEEGFPRPAGRTPDDIELRLRPTGKSDSDHAESSSAYRPEHYGLNNDERHHAM